MEPALMKSVVVAQPLLSEDTCRVRDVLIARGLETPFVDNGLSRDQKYERNSESFADVARTLGLDPADDSLCDTPRRIAKMYVDEIFSGLDYARFPKASAIANKLWRSPLTLCITA